MPKNQHLANVDRAAVRQKLKHDLPMNFRELAVGTMLSYFKVQSLAKDPLFPDVDGLIRPSAFWEFFNKRARRSIEHRLATHV